MPASSDANGRIRATPLARAVAREFGVDLAEVTGSGRGRRIMRADVQAFAAVSSPPPAAAVTSAPVAGFPAAEVPVAAGPAAVRSGAAPVREAAAAGGGLAPAAVQAPVAAVGLDGEVEELPLSSMRRVVARRLVESVQSTPHFYLTITVDAQALVGFRAELNRQVQARGEDLKVSVNDLVVKACAVLLRANPELNVSWGGDRLLRHRRVHVGIAVALEGGLIVPVIRDADQKSLTQVAREAKGLIGRARAGRLAAGELSGGTFTVSNLGMFGIDQFTAVINPPEAAILAVGAALAEPVATAAGGVVVHQRMRLTLSIDHRALDGATGAGFLQQLKGVLEHPLQIVA
jgi:pyruvate dehydrogenase E2 component (dihydrolipoamide acetyltransferase)